MDLHKKNIPEIDQCLTEGALVELNGYLFDTMFMAHGAAQAEKIMNMKGSDKGVVIMGLAKTGNHFFMSLLDALGCDRAEEFQADGLISAMPFEAQFTLEAYDQMEKRMAEATRPLILPHCHLYSSMFPDNFKGKIICITRDPRAVAASAYHFLKQIPHYKPYFDIFGFKSLEDFCQHDVKGHTYWGDVDEYDQSWREYAKRNPNVDVLFVKFEDVISDKPLYIKKIADFVGITDYNLKEVIENSSVPSTMERRRKKYEKYNREFGEIICYRKGQTGSWKDELSEETKKLYAEKYPNHPIP